MTQKVVFGLRWALTRLGTFVLIGCGGDAVDLSKNAPELGNGVENDLGGVWGGTLSGTVTGSAFVTSPKTVRLEIDRTGAGNLLVGVAALPAPTDPSVGYPPEAQADAGEATGLLMHLYEGVTYPLNNASVNGNALHFELDAMSAFEPWCALQVPISTDVGSRCRENWGGGVDRSGGEKRCFVTNPNTGEQEEEDCLALWLCSIDIQKGCMCDATTCAASDGGWPATATFDLQLDQAASVLEGSLTWNWEGSPPTLPVRLTRQ